MFMYLCLLRLIGSKYTKGMIGKKTLFSLLFFIFSKANHILPSKRTKAGFSTQRRFSFHSVVWKTLLKTVK